MHGADVAQLRSLAHHFESEAQRLDAHRMTVGNAIPISAWFGPFAVRFRLRWESDYSRRVHDAAIRLRTAAKDLRRNADEQDHASSAGGGLSTAFGHPADTIGKPGPTSTAQLYETLHGMDKNADGVRVQVIRGDDGKDRIVVYINGTFSASGDLFSAQSNVELMTGQENATLRHVRALVADAAKAYPGAEIMLAGYSQGGIVAQRLAQEHQFNITTVVTFGSPRLPDSELGKIAVVRLEHNGDPIPQMDLRGAALIGGAIVGGPVFGAELDGIVTGVTDATNSAAAHQAGGSDVVFRGGNPLQVYDGLPHTDHADYDWLADQFDKSARPEDELGRESLRRFSGSVVDDVR